MRVYAMWGLGGPRGLGEDMLSLWTLGGARKGEKGQK
jgi:hypothetical protein